MKKSSKLNYFGKVNLKIKIKDKLVTLKFHNTGTENIFISLANYLAGNTLKDNNLISIPDFIDLKVSSGDEGYEEAITCLKTEGSIPITRKDMSNTNSGGRLHTSVIYEATITKNALDITSVTSPHYYICLCDKNKVTLAYLTFDSSYINIINQPGTQAIIIWETEITNSTN